MARKQHTKPCQLMCIVQGLTCIVVQELDLWQSEGVVEGHEDGWLDQDVNQVHGRMAKEEGRRVQACKA